MAFGFGLTVLLLLSGVRTGLLDTWYASLPTDAPNHFMINIQREEADGVRALVTKGAVPQTLVVCDRVRRADAEVPLDAALRARLDGYMHELGSQGLRVLAVATRTGAPATSISTSSALRGSRRE